MAAISSKTSHTSVASRAAPHTYSKQKAVELVGGEAIEQLKKTAVFPNFYLRKRVAFLKPGGSLYVLIIGREPKKKFLYFSSSTYRERYIVTQVKEPSQEALNDFLFGEKGIIEKLNLYARCASEKDFWTLEWRYSTYLPQEKDFKFQAFFLAAIRVGESFCCHAWHNFETRAQALCRGGTFGPEKGYVSGQEKALAEGFIEEQFFDLLVKNKGDYILIENVETDRGPRDVYFYWQEGGTPAFRFVSDVEWDEFVENQPLEVEVFQTLKVSDRYPESMGFRLLDVAVEVGPSPTVAQAVLERCQQAPEELADKEYVSYPEIKTGHKIYSQVAPFIYYTAAQGYQLIFFNNEKRRDLFIKINHLRDGKKRDYFQQQLALWVGSQLLSVQEEKERKPLLFVFPHPDNRKSCFLTFSLPEMITKFYFMAEEVEERLFDFLPTHRTITLQELREVPLTLQESELLTQRLSKKENYFIQISAPPREAEPTKRNFCTCEQSRFYSAIFCHSAYGDPLIVDEEVWFYRRGSSALARKMEELKSSGFQKIETQ